MRRSLPVLIVLIVLAGLSPAPARAQATTASIVDEAARALQRDPVYVHPDAENAISGREADALRRRIAERDAAPLYVVIVPGAIRAEGGGGAAGAAELIARQLGRPGTYAIVAGGEFRAGSVGGVLDRGVAGDLATQAYQRKRDAGVRATLEEFIDLVGKARAAGGAAPDNSAPGGGGAGALGLLALLASGAGLLAWRRRRRRRREQAEQVAELRETAREDLVALGDDIRALDLDVQMPGVSERAKEDYAVALDRYERAERVLDGATRPETFGAIGQALEEGRYAMAAAKARLQGQEPPERRPPCFFDPRHGPSTRDVLWAPDGYAARPVPVCEADAVRLESGEDPMTREVTAGGRRVPLYDAPGFYAPYAGGFFGGFTGFLPGLLFGSMLGTGLGGLTAAASADPGDFGDGDFGGGGDFDFGGGGDFGGGDVGGGDF